MNERYKQLAEQAGLKVESFMTNPPKPFQILGSTEQFEKFAELIVNECIGCCEQVISDPVPESVDTWLNGGTQCMAEIKQHFGVEE